MEENNWHASSLADIFEKFGTSEEGLSSQQAEDNLKKYGPNKLDVEEGTGILEIILEQVKSPLIYLLAAAAVVSLAVQHYADAGIIFGVVILNTIIDVIQQWRAENALEKLHKMAAPKATVVRDGRTDTIPASEVVPGDMLELETGQRVAADARVISSEELQVNESSLTGESQSVYKNSEKVKEDTPLADRSDMVWMSTAVTSGRGRAVVVETGMDSELGEIADQVQRTEREKTPLQKKVGKLGTYLGVTGIILAVGLFLLGLFQGYKLIDILLFSIAAAVSAIPEGLPAVISITLALGVQKMARRNSIIRRLPAVETLGSTTVVCTDKTGTITKNEMTVTDMWAGGKLYKVTGRGYKPEGEILHEETNVGKDKYPQELKELLETGCFANNAYLQEEDEGWEIEGEPTEGALIAASAKAGFDCGILRDEKQRLDEIPFSSDKKYMATLYPDKQEYKVYVKGAPDRILDFCNSYIQDGEVKEIDEDFRRKIEEINDRMAERALRVIAGACKKVPKETKTLKEDEVTEGLVFAGLWGMVDPPREEAIEAISDAKKAGIKVLMLTGDHAVTASAIARQTNITESEKPALTGADIEDIGDEEIIRHAYEVGVFARVSPKHKLKILNALKDNGQIVAMTGDGVNDAPALKGADIGVAMGASGTEVAREAADMILTDDNFATIIHAVEEGRVIFSNLVSVSFFLLSSSTNEMVTLAFALILKLPLPLTAIMILWINLVTDGSTDVPLGVEPKHRDVLKLPPRPVGSGIVDMRLLMRILILAAVVSTGTLGLFYIRQQDASLHHAQTLAFTTLAAFQWFLAFNSRSRYLSIFKIGVFSNRWLLVGVAVAVLLQLGVVYTPAGNAVFKTAPLTWMDWAMLLPAALTVVIVDEVMKFFKVYGSVRENRK